DLPNESYNSTSGVGASVGATAALGFFGMTPRTRGGGVGSCGIGAGLCCWIFGWGSIAVGGGTSGWAWTCGCGTCICGWLVATDCFSNASLKVRVASWPSFEIVT